MAIAIVDAVRLAKTNQLRHEHLIDRQEKLHQQVTAANSAQQKARQTLYDEALVPFRDVFQRLKQINQVEMAEPAVIEMPTGVSEVDIERRRLGARAATAAVGALAGSALTGYSAGAGTYLAVGALASASTGTAISGLSGAAATSAMLAWLGGGSLAAGGGGVAAGTLVLTGIVAAPAVLSLAALGEWQSRRLRRGEQQRAQELEQCEAKTREAEDAAAALDARSKDMQRILQGLQFTLLRRLPPFTTLVETCDDFTQYDLPRRAKVAEMVDLAGLAVMVMSCPITDAEGMMTEESGRVVAYAEARLRALNTES
ncbi:hypothetical protein [Streptomyces sp. NPDC059378]|uniref:hypothetical protein n=1 Tax=Streptomyces sp. NPDC059378 TaxID=3346815 RepID=UPI003698DC91